MNKNLWSTSYVLLMAGFGSVLLAVIYGIVDSGSCGTAHRCGTWA